MTVTTSKLARAAGLASVAAGLLFIVIQPIHPTEDLAAVSGDAWTITSYMTATFAVLALIGISGMYLRQAEATGVLGLTGYVMFSAFLVLTVAYTFVEIFILPPLVELAPQFVDSFNGISTGDAGPLLLPALETLWTVVFVLYFGGSVLLGTALIRARVFPRWAGASLVVAALATLTVPALPHSLERYAAVPMGLALIALGYLQWSQRRGTPTVVTPETTSNTLDMAAAE